MRNFPNPSQLYCRGKPHLPSQLSQLRELDHFRSFPIPSFLTARDVV